MKSDQIGPEPKSALTGWKYKKLIECTRDGNLSYGIVQPGRHVDHGVPIIRVNNVNNGQLRLDEVLCVASEIEEKYIRTRLEGGEVLLTLVGSTGQSVVVPQQLAGWNIARAIGVIRPRPEIGANWINICLQTKAVQQFLDERANTTVQKTLNLGDVRELPIPIPPSEVKEQIEAFAMGLADKIEINRHINQTLEQMAQAIFKSWFVDFEPVKAKIAAMNEDRDPLRAAMCAISGKSETELNQLTSEQYEQLAVTAALFPDELVYIELGEIPRGWNIGNLGNHAGFLNGYAFKSKDWTDEGHPVIKIGDVKPGIINLYGCSNVSTETLKGLDRFRLNRGDLLVGMTGYVGETGLVLSHKPAPYLNQRVGKLLVRGGLAGMGYVYCLVRSSEFKSFAEMQAHGSAQANVSSSALMSYSAIIPTEETLINFNKKIYPILELILTNYEENVMLTSIRDALLPRLLLGKVPLSAIEVTEA